MSQFFANNKEILTFCAGVLGTLLSLAFGGLLKWRHHICLDYESRRDVAINILRDRYIQRTSDHYENVAKEHKRVRTDITEIYKRPESQSLIRELARDLEDQNRIRRLFRWLLISSQAAFGFVWAAIVITLLGILGIWFNPPFALVVTWGSLLSIALLGFIAAVSLMWFLDGRFFVLVHAIIEPEGE